MEKVIKEAARGLRKNLTETEDILWGRLRNRQLEGCKFRRQQPLGRFVADFVCLEKSLIVELDGGHHADQSERDHERDSFLKESGYKVLRFWNHEVTSDIEKVLATIRQNL
jgi:very-short-patch-repair endonuclease